MHKPVVNPLHQVLYMPVDDAPQQVGEGDDGDRHQPSSAFFRAPTMNDMVTGFKTVLNPNWRVKEEEREKSRLHAKVLGAAAAAHNPKTAPGLALWKAALEFCKEKGVEAQVLFDADGSKSPLATWAEAEDAGALNAIATELFQHGLDKNFVLAGGVGLSRSFSEGYTLGQLNGDRPHGFNVWFRTPPPSDALMLAAWSGNYNSGRREGAGTGWGPNFTIQGKWENHSPDTAYTAKVDFKDFDGEPLQFEGTASVGKTLYLCDGELRTLKGDVHKGDWRNLAGGLSTFTDGTVYEGGWLTRQSPQDDVWLNERRKSYVPTPDRQGKLTDPQGGVYEGLSRRGLRHGRGTQTYSDGSVYQGAWEKGQRQGDGRLLEIGGTLVEGTFLNDLPDGKLTQTDVDGQTCTVTFIGGKKVGGGQPAASAPHKPGASSDAARISALEKDLGTATRAIVKLQAELKETRALARQALAKVERQEALLGAAVDAPAAQTPLIDFSATGGCPR